MQDAITVNNPYRCPCPSPSPSLCSPLLPPSEPPLSIWPSTASTASFPSDSCTRSSRMIAITALYAATTASSAAPSSPPGPALAPYLIILNSPRIPLARARTPAPRSSGPFRHQILHSTTPDLPLKPPHLRLSSVYISGLVFLRNSITVSSTYNSSVVYAESVLESLLSIFQPATSI